MRESTVYQISDIERLISEFEKLNPYQIPDIERQISEFEDGAQQEYCGGPTDGSGKCEEHQVNGGRECPNSNCELWICNTQFTSRKAACRACSQADLCFTTSILRVWTNSPACNDGPSSDIEAKTLSLSQYDHFPRLDIPPGNQTIDVDSR